jgi:predicted transcriptional regulator
MTAASPMTVKLDLDLRQRLMLLAEQQHTSAHALLKEAIVAFVQKEEEKQALNKASLEAWVHFQETGIHATHEEVSAWIDSWGKDVELDVPQCRA